MSSFKFEQLDEVAQGEAVDLFYGRLVEAVAEGAVRFSDELNGDDLQARIDEAARDMERMQTPWFLAERLSEDETVRESLRGMARCDAEDALYIGPDSPEVVRLASTLTAVNPSTNRTTGELVLNPGTVLPNGCTVVAASARNANEWIVLAMREGFHGDDNYITWKCARPGDASDTKWGHYFDSIGEAVSDFETRA